MLSKSLGKKNIVRITKDVLCTVRLTNNRRILSWFVSWFIMMNGHGEQFLVGIIERKAHNDHAVFVFIVVALFIDKRASF